MPLGNRDARCGRIAFLRNRPVNPVIFGGVRLEGKIELDTRFVGPVSNHGGKLAGGGVEDLVDTAESLEQAGESFGADAGDQVEAKPFFDEFFFGMFVFHEAPFEFM